MAFLSIFDLQDRVFVLVFMVAIDAKHTTLPFDHLIPILCAEHLIDVIEVTLIGIPTVFDEIGPGQIWICFSAIEVPRWAFDYNIPCKFGQS